MQCLPSWGGKGNVKGCWEAEPGHGRVQGVTPAGKYLCGFGSSGKGETNSANTSTRQSHHLLRRVPRGVVKGRSQRNLQAAGRVPPTAFRVPPTAELPQSQQTHTTKQEFAYSHWKQKGGNSQDVPSLEMPRAGLGGTLSNLFSLGP